MDSVGVQVYTFWKILYQNPLYVLRYTTFIEIMAPMFRMDMFNGLVGPSLHNAYYGESVAGRHKRLGMPWGCTSAGLAWKWAAPACAAMKGWRARE